MVAPDSQKSAGHDSVGRGSGYLTARDGTQIYYRDCGSGDPIIFLSNWALHSEMWGYQMTPLSRRGFRCIAVDRRGTGRSTQPATGYDYDTLSDDLAALIEKLDLRNVTLVGHSMGNGESVRYLSRHGTSRVSRLVMIAPTLPFLLKTDDNPEGMELSVFDQMRADWLRDYPKWVADNIDPYFIAGTSSQMMDWVAKMALQCSMHTAWELSYSWSETDFRREIEQITVPVLLIQGDQDSLPIALTADRVARLLRNGCYHVYKDEAHGLLFTSSQRLNSELEAFIRG